LSNFAASSARRIEPPASERELLDRARRLAGLRLGELAAELGAEVPSDLRRAKGFVGTLVERALGAAAGSRAQPDFETLGVELKTLPVDGRGRPLESTFVCTIPLTEIGEVEWSASRVRRKLSRVLWVPVEGERALPVARRRIGEPLLWELGPEAEASLRFDWEELAGLIGRGDVESITGHLGRFLQVRPKARDSRSRRRGVDADGAPFLALPRGFYLRTAFTAAILEQHYVLGSGSGAIAR
jgi:DNA mismatch repair protein MutH